MYTLNSAPIFFEFLDRFLKKANSKIKIKHTNKLFLHDKCLCGSDDCNSFVLKTSNRVIKDFYLCHTLYTNKGTFGIEISDDGTFFFSATQNNNFPFQNEFNKMFNDYKKSVRKSIFRYHHKQKLSIKDTQKLHRFFWDLKIEEHSKIYEDIDIHLKQFI